MAHRTDPAKWKPEGGVVDLVSEDEDEPADTTEDDSSPDRKRIRYSEPTDDDCRSYMARNLAHHQPLPASFRRLVNGLEADPTTQVTDISCWIYP
ncbi:hypothetical protein CYMTET_37257 [Cymbomonas tetramitiformis]|uniref:Uncharacterized protein n=1 Tax=Cymbomonas tetramitiformis TaxID=36881 RepID=A0AAE0CFR2_9CHLO|nr:hypothetical protein CYMTET_37257 [Cymbomonas tetramitiformis]